METELFVSLKVPDNVALTAFHTLQRMGYNKLKTLERQDYYKFEFEGDQKNFQKKISNVDILVNANKHKHSFQLDKGSSDFEKVHVLVQDLDNGNGLKNVLQSRLGFKNIKKVEKGVLWILSIDSDKEGARTMADEIAKELLMNENYQKMRLIE